MARSRNIKPGFFANDALAECEPLARLLFAGLWTICDREGRAEDRPKRIRAELLPYDDCNVDDLLAQLTTAGFLIRYSAEGGKYLQVVNFIKHQDPHYKEKASEIPAPPGHADSVKTAGGVAEAVRQSVFDRDGRACKSCASTEDLSLDHIVPRSKGGSHEESNLQTLCRRCNSAKNNRDAKSIIGQSSTDDESRSALEPGNKPPLIPSPLIPDSLISDSKEEKSPRKREPDLQRPHDVAEQVWKDWLQLRRGKKAAVTDTVIRMARSEAQKADMPLEGFLSIWCARGSQGMEADWIKPAERAKFSSNKYSGAAASIFDAPDQREVIDV